MTREDVEKQISDPIFYNKLKQRVIALCYSTFKNQNPDDLLHELILYRLEQPNRTGNLKQLIIDIYRKTAGRKGTASEAKEAINHSSMSFEDLDADEWIKGYESITDVHVDIENLMDNLEDREHYVITRYFLEGKLLSEIGKDLQITESRANQLKAVALLKLKMFATGDTSEYLSYLEKRMDKQTKANRRNREKKMAYIKSLSDTFK